MLIWHSGSDARVMLRPSGTEPELKIYAEAVYPVTTRAGLPAARTAAAQRVEQLLSEAMAALRAAWPADGSAPTSRSAPGNGSAPGIRKGPE